KIEETTFQGQGGVVANQLELSNEGLQHSTKNPAYAEAKMLLWSASKEDFKMGGVIDAAIMTAGKLKSENAEIHGNLVVEDTPCSEVSSSKTDKQCAEFYLTELPKFKIVYPTNYPGPGTGSTGNEYFYSHVTMS